ncbi:peroxiredoxin [Rhizobium sp. TRM95111]|uniref:peroxiredoxin n=1 Tax=Rhizobium alarense TaxID=2846851 RepID=UPI001F16CD97|nr:peroxiredoxin [Rhizobium alarense]MCF3639024.1 peroxiredoxin [Rhizobium alarense]
MAELSPGALAPGFSLQRDGGTTVELVALRGRVVVLYFYPKDDTKACTEEAIDFSRLMPAFRAADAEVFGVSADPVKKHDKFVAKHGLGVPLLSDETLDMLQAYGVWVEKRMYGRAYMGIERTTVLIGRDGRIARIWPKVKVAGHAEEVLAAARSL